MTTTPYIPTRTTPHTTPHTTTCTHVGKEAQREGEVAAEAEFGLMAESKMNKEARAMRGQTLAKEDQRAGEMQFEAELAARGESQISREMKAMREQQGVNQGARAAENSMTQKSKNSKKFRDGMEKAATERQKRALEDELESLMLQVEAKKKDLADMEDVIGRLTGAVALDKRNGGSGGGGGGGGANKKAKRPSTAGPNNKARGKPNRPSESKLKRNEANRSAPPDLGVERHTRPGHTGPGTRNDKIAVTPKKERGGIKSTRV